MELFDHIFVSHFLVTGTRPTEVTTVTAVGGIPSIDDNPNARIGELAQIMPRWSRRSTSRRSLRDTSASCHASRALREGWAGRLASGSERSAVSTRLKHLDLTSDSRVCFSSPDTDV
jgi:hypothetical protein